MNKITDIAPNILLITASIVVIVTGLTFTARGFTHFAHQPAMLLSDSIRQSADIVINRPNTIAENRVIETVGTLRIEASDVVLKNVTVRCIGDAHAFDGIHAVHANRLHFINVQVENCGRNGIVIQGGKGHELLEGSVTNSKLFGILLNGVSDSIVAGWNLDDNGSGLFLENHSNRNIIVATQVLRVKEGHGFVVSQNSSGNQLVRNRARDIPEEYFGALDNNSNNLWYGTVCSRAEKFASCHGNTNKAVTEHGDPASFSPRIWTVCQPHTFDDQNCDFSRPQAAVNVANSGDIIVVDSDKNWPITAVTKPLWILGNTRSQSGTYGYETRFADIDVTSSGVILQNLYLNVPAPAPSISAMSTSRVKFYNVWAREGESWVGL